jgi:hypothetical protein
MCNGVKRYNRSRDVDRTQEVRPKSGYTTGVISSNRSRAYDRSRVFRPELGIRPKSHIRLESWYTNSISMYNG